LELILILQIEKLIYGGDGLARLPADAHGRGKTAFVPFVIPGEQVEASPVETRSGFVRATLDQVLTASPDRIEPGCVYFGRCGGCHYQHINYDAQLRCKADILRETLRRTAKLDLIPEIQLHPSPPWNYRSRTRMRVRHTPQFALGYFQHNSHDVLPVEICPISSPLINQAIAAVWKLGRDGAVPQSLHGLQFFANHDDTKLLGEAYVRPAGQASSVEAPDVSPAPRGAQASRALAPAKIGLKPGLKAPSKEAADLQPFAAALHGELPQMAGVVVFPTSALDDGSRQSAPLTAIHSGVSRAIGDKSLIYHAAGCDYRVSGGSFFQTNRFLTETLVQTVVADRKGRGALDLYAGAGLFTAQLARNFDTVLAVESSPHAFADLRHNVPSNVKCVPSTCERFLAERAAKLAPDLVVVDPPRAGLGDNAARALGRMTVPHVTYVSCDPATLSRDLRVLLEFNFRVEQAHLLDMFPQTFHMETVLHLAR
jgi:23S rRNA (uracil1939-C5)-methyltransferase